MSKKKVTLTAREFLEGRCQTLADQARQPAVPHTTPNGVKVTQFHYDLANAVYPEGEQQVLCNRNGCDKLGKPRPPLTSYYCDEHYADGNRKLGRTLATLQPGTTTGNTGLWLRNRHGWVFHYVADDGGRGDRVTVTRTYRGEPVGEYVMPRCEARAHYRGLREGGFETFGGDL